MDLLTMAIVLVGVATVGSRPRCEQMCNKNCAKQMLSVKTKTDEIHKSRDSVTAVSTTPDEELNKAHAPHERMHDKPKKQKEGKEGKEDWEELAGGHDDDSDRDEHGNQYLAELLTSIDSEITSMQATNMDDENDRFDDILQF